MSDFHPIHDTWFLARSKTKYYGAMPGGLLWRARTLLGVGPTDTVLHVCSGKILESPFGGLGLGQNDYTMDIDPELKPDFCQDVREPWPFYNPPDDYVMNPLVNEPWDAILCDPPYSPEDASHYACGKDVYPEPGAMLKRAFEVLRPGGRVGMLHYQLPRPPAKTARLVAVITVYVGFGNKGRCYSVFEKAY